MSLTPPYSLLTRTSKGSQLTIEELDGNLLFLASTLSGSNTITGSVNFTGSLVDFLQVGTVTGSFSGDGSGLTGVTATVELPAGVVSSSLQFTGTDDVTFRNITASGNISASGNIYANTGSFNHVYSAGDINIDNQGKVWLDGGSDSYIWLSNNNHIGLVAGNTQTLTVDNNSIEVDGYISGSGFIQVAGTVNTNGVIISASNSSGDTRDAQMIVPEHGFEIKNASNNNVLKIYDSQVGINVNAVSSGDYALQVSGSSGGTKAIEAIGDISASGDIISTGTGSFNYVTTPTIEGSGSTALLHIEGQISASGTITAPSFTGAGTGTVVNITGDVSASGFVSASNIHATGNITAVSMSGDGSGLTGITAALPAGVVSSSLQFTNTDDVTFRNITASGNISASGNVLADHVLGNRVYVGPVAASARLTFDGTSIVNNMGLQNTGNITASSNISSSGTVIAGAVTTTGNISSSAGYLYGERVFASRGFIDNLAADTIYGGDGANTAITLNAVAGLSLLGPVTASGNISSSGTVIAGNLNIDATNASSSLSVGIEEKVPALGILNITSSGIVNQAYPLGNTGRITHILGDTTLGLGGFGYTSDGENLFYKSGSVELWRQVGEVDLSSIGGQRTVGHLSQYSDNSMGGTAGTYNEFYLFSGENVGEKFGGAYVGARYSGSSERLYAGFFASSSLTNPGTHEEVDRAFTIFTGGTHTGPAFHIYRYDDPDNVYNNSPSFTIDSAGHVTASGDISASGAIYGNILTAAQIGITQVGMLTGLAVNGNTMLSGNVTQSGNISSSGDLIGDNLQVETRTMPVNHMGGGAGARSGDIINLGNSTTVPGLIYALTGSSYEYVAAQSGSGALASGSLAVAIGTNSNTNGMLLRGFVNLGHDPGGHIGAAVYLTANGSASYLAPTATGDVVRVLGHNFGNNSIYFNPSNDWIVRS